MSKKYQYLANRRKSPLYERACDASKCKFKTSHFYTNCSVFLNRYYMVGRTRREQQHNDNQKVIYYY